jgi:alkylation response protein AidB-like acyl-CoA dehydrogenase
MADRNTSTYFDNVRVPRAWGISGPVAWSLFETSAAAPFPLNSGNMMGILQGAFDVLLEYTDQRVAGGRRVNQHLSAAMILGEMASLLTIGRAAFLELAHQYDHMETYGMWTANSMVAKAHAVHSYLTRTSADMILKGMELMGSYGYVRENHYEKYYRDAPIAKLVMGGSHLGYFAACRQFYDLDYSSFGPGKLTDPTV